MRGSAASCRRKLSAILRARARDHDQVREQACRRRDTDARGHSPRSMSSPVRSKRIFIGLPARTRIGESGGNCRAGGGNRRNSSGASACGHIDSRRLSRRAISCDRRGNRHPRSAITARYPSRSEGVPGDGADEVEEDDRHHERPEQRFAPAQQMRSVHAGQIEASRNMTVVRTASAGGATVMKEKKRSRRRPRTRRRPEIPGMSRARDESL